uniref:Uncharacterized protein n=1 Tax=Rhizophora mucronata TaxID=61149 RepID=A0A2P2NRC6_RHIMU
MRMLVLNVLMMVKSSGKRSQGLHR